MKYISFIVFYSLSIVGLNLMLSLFNIDMTAIHVYIYTLFFIGLHKNIETEDNEINNEDTEI